MVVSVQPTLAGDSNAFAATLTTLATSQTSPSASPKTTIVPVRENADPFLSTYNPLRQGALVSVTAPSSILVQSVSHLYKLAHYPIVIHVAVSSTTDAHGTHADYGDITAIRQCGFTLLHSESAREAADLALTAHTLAVRTGKGVIHFFEDDKLASSEPFSPRFESLIESIADIPEARRWRAPRDARDQTIYLNASQPALVSAGPQALAENGKTATPEPRTTDSSSSESPRRDSDGSLSKASETTSLTSVDSQPPKPVASEDIFSIARSIWSQIAQVTGRKYTAFEYSGPRNAKSALFAFGADVGLLSEEMGAAQPNEAYANAGLITARLYRPWLAAAFREALPESVTKIAVLEQVRRKTTKWGPLLMDVLTSLSTTPQRAAAPTVVGYQLGQLEPSTIRQALTGIFTNLSAEQPVQNLEVGTSARSTLVEQPAPEQPALENAYMKILDQLFKTRLHIANRSNASSAGVSALTAATPEFGFGALQARLERRRRFVGEVQAAARSNEFITEAPKSWLSRWALDAEDSKKSDTLAQQAIARLKTDGSPLAQRLLKEHPFFYKESPWLIGSDAWAYDLGNSGVHHVLASGENVNMLIIESTPYSERAAADAERRKKDIALYAMNFGNAYVASTAVYSSYTQVLEAMLEADRFHGPSVVLAYLPYNRESDSPLTVLQETKKAVDIGYWPLFRWTPAADDGEPDFKLDSERIKKELEDFLRRDNQLTQLMRRQPQFAANLSGSYGTEVRELQKRKAKDAYGALLESLQGAPLTILFASDNGNAENLSKRLAKRGKARGLKTMVMAMDEYPLEDLASEENVLFISSTAGQGEIPQNGRTFWEGFKNSTDLDLSTVRFSTFALGDSHYWPRKEDKIYYNKPGKDIHARATALGGQTLVDIGLGDDQDPDGYNTGYNEWEPKLWQSLNVANVEGLPEEPPPLTNEDIKIQSNYLRGTIMEGLEDPSTGAISASDAQLTKFHGTYMQDDRDLRDERKAQGLEPAYSFMIRCRLPGGVATAQQWIQMDDISNDLGNETMKLTTRQTFQFHGVVKSKLRPAMQAINQSLMTTIAACGDVNRNVMCSSLPENASLHEDVQRYAQKISDHLLPSTSAYHEIWLADENDKKTQIAGDAVQDFEPLYGPTYLPRKFKITIAIPPHNDTDVYAHDIGLIAIRDGQANKIQGFNLVAGGGMGVTHNNKKTYPRTGSMFGFVTPDQVHVACEKIMLVQRDNGDRTNRKHARLKYTIDDMGVEVFKAKVEELWGQKFGEPKAFHFDSNIDTFGWQKDERGMNHFTMFIENGRIEDTAEFPMKTGLREIAKVHQGEFRLTGNQHLILSNVSEEQLDKMKGMLKQHKLDNTNFSALRLSSSACVAFPTCGLAMAESERYLPKMISLLETTVEAAGLRQDSIVMRMTGCPNGCARPWVAEIACVGKAYGTYNLYLGGGYHGQRLNKLYRSSIGEEEILSILRPMVKEYSVERNQGERFGDFVVRKKYIKATTEGKTFHEDTAEVEDDDE